MPSALDLHGSYAQAHVYMYMYYVQSLYMKEFEIINVGVVIVGKFTRRSYFKDTFLLALSFQNRANGRVGRAASTHHLETNPHVSNENAGTEGHWRPSMVVCQSCSCWMDIHGQVGVDGGTQVARMSRSTPAA